MALQRNEQFTRSAEINAKLSRLFQKRAELARVVQPVEKV
jgi:hypothetical protein